MSQMRVEVSWPKRGRCIRICKRAFPLIVSCITPFSSLAHATQNRPCQACCYAGCPETNALTKQHSLGFNSVQVAVCTDSSTVPILTKSYSLYLAKKHI